MSIVLKPEIEKQWGAGTAEEFDREYAVAGVREFVTLGDYVTLYSSDITQLRAIVEAKLPQESILLGTLGDGRFKFKSPIEVRLRSEDDQIVAEAVGIDEFGYGQTQHEALRDLQEAIIEVYLAFHFKESNLGPDLRRVWDLLKERVELVHP